MTRENVLWNLTTYRTPLKAITTSRIFPAAVLENPKKLRMPLKQTYYLDVKCVCFFAF